MTSASEPIETEGPSGASIDLDWRLILDALADPVIAADASNRIVYLNHGAERLLGWPAGELLDRPLTTIQPPRLREAHTAGFERYMRTGIPTIMGQPIRVPALRRDGQEIDIELTIAGLRLPNGKRLAVASLRDLRERVELERQLRITRYLRASTDAAARITSLLDLEQVLQTVVDALVTDFDAALARIWLYEAETDTLHLRASAGLSTRTTDSSRAHIDVATYPYKVGQVARSRKQFVRNDLSGDPEFEQEWIEREAISGVGVYPLLIGGELRGVMVCFSRLPLSDEVAVVLSSFTAIVTAAVNDVLLFQREQAARAEAEDAVRLRDEFLTTVSHDLKNPIAAIKGRAQLLRRRAARLPDDESRYFAESVESIDASAGRMTRLINDLVDIARLRAGRPLDLQREPVDLVQLIRCAVEEVQQTTDHHTIRVVIERDALIGSWDATRLERVLVNLLSNAVKYSPSGGEITVAVREDSSGAEPAAVVSVRDRGIGIPARDLPHIFERYRRGANVVERFEGTGVGLAGARQIIEQHGGTIAVESQEGAGANFEVRLPLG